MDSSKLGRSARWGGACAPCAVARTRCVRTQSSASQPCDRCRSLGKECIAQNSGPRKKRMAKSSHDTRTTLQEGESNDLIDLSGTFGGESSSAHGSLSNGSLSRGSLSTGSLHNFASNNPASSISLSPLARFSPRQLESNQKSPAHGFTPGEPTGPTCTCMSTEDVGDLVPVEPDETLLSIFRNQLSGPLPFVIIPASTTAKQLQTGRPFLMKVIRMVASVRHLRLVRGQSRAVMAHIADAILMRSERSLDLLQGIMAFLGSYHYHCMVHAQFNNLIRLAVSLVEDLDLGTSPKSEQIRGQLPLVRAEEPASRTNEEKRALLGVWYMSSNAGLVMKQLALMRYTKYMDQCLRDLDEAAEFKTDQFAIQLVRIQQLTERIFQFHDSDSLVDEQRALPDHLSMARLETFRAELASLRDVLPLHLQSDNLLSCYHNRAYLRIYAPLLAGSHLPDVDPQSFASLQLSSVPMAEVFSHFTAALKAWLENWLAIPVCSYFYMPQPAYTQLVHGAMMLTRWVRVAGPDSVKLSSAGSATGPLRALPSLSGVPECPDLDVPRPSASQSAHAASAQILNALRADVAAHPHLQVDVLGILDAMAARFEAAKREMTAAQGLDWENDTWDFAAKHTKMKKARIEKWCEMVATAAGQGGPPTTNPYDGAREESGESGGKLPEWSVDDLGWMESGYDWDDMQWESFTFDEVLRDIHK